jgi:hypothetical protein
MAKQPPQMPPPHLLDHLFSGDASESRQRFYYDEAVIAAFESAARAYREQAKKPREQQIGLPPQQAARGAFLGALNLATR